MCGVFGVWYDAADRIPSTTALCETAGLIRHRGPDASGVHTGPGVGLAFTRLSFLDIDARSNQPLWDPTGDRLRA